MFRVVHNTTLTARLRHATASVRRGMHGSAAVLQDKRPLQEAQIHGGAAPGGSSSSAKVNATSSTSASSGGGGGGALLGMAALAVLGGGGAYYYYNNQQSLTANKEMPSTAETTSESSTVTPEENKKSETKDSSEVASAAPHRVTTIDLPASMKNTAAKGAVPQVKEHPSDGHRVLMKTAKEEPTTSENEEDEADAELETERALAALQTSVTAAATEALLASHPTMWTATSVASASAPLGDLETLSVDQLKGRVVQLATELKDRTKWEALRLKEFLAMKEQEVSTEYTKLLQKQRIEFEDLLARRLREQEHALRSQLESALREKDASIQSLVDAALEAQQQDFAHEKETYETVTRAEIQQQLEAKYSKQIEELKKSTAADLQAKVEVLEALSAQVAQLSEALSNSKSHQQGSAQAHRLSAAALSLSDKLATDQPAGPEINALASVVGADGGVIATAVATIPPSAHTDGVPTLAQLQTWFEDIFDKVRQAALVPAGRPGLEGQLAARVLAMIKFAPRASDDDDEGDTAETSGKPSPAGDTERILAKARRLVQKGDLAAALEVLETLPAGQATLTLADWKEAVLNRIMVDKAVKVIKMECALLNESLA